MRSSLCSLDIRCAVALYLGLMFAAGLSADAGSLYSAYCRPDAIDFADSVHAYVRNSGDAPLRVQSVSVDGADLGPVFDTGANFLEPDIRNKFIAVHNENVLWYRVYPNPIPAGGIAEIIIRRIPPQPGRSATVTVRLDDGGALSATIPAEDPAIWLDYVTFSEDLQEIWVYARRRPGSRDVVEGIELDGRTLAAEVFPSWHGVVCARVRLQEPLRYCSDHVVAVRAASGFRHAAMLRAIPMPLPVGIMGNNSEREIKEYASHFFDTNIAFTPVSAARYEPLERHGLTGCYIYYYRARPEQNEYEPVFYAQTEVLEPIRAQPALWAYFLEDEPDGRYHRSELSIQGIARDVERAQTFCRIFDPDHPTYLQMDHGSFPKNLFRWGLIPDLLCCHAYALGRQIVRPTREHVELTREATWPKPFYYLCQGYCANAEREFDPLEMQLEVLTALAEGAKGLQWYPAHGDRGLLKHPRMWHAVGRVNAALRMAMPYIAMGTPVSGARSDNRNVDAQAILCGDQALGIIVRNDQFVSQPDRFELTPAVNVTVHVGLPRFLPCAAIVRLTPTGPEDLAFDRDGRHISLTLPRIEAGEVLLVLRDEAQAEAISRQYDAELKDKVLALPADG